MRPKILDKLVSLTAAPSTQARMERLTQEQQARARDHATAMQPIIAQALAAADREAPGYREAIEKLERQLKPRHAELVRRRSELTEMDARLNFRDSLTVRAEALLTSGQVIEPPEVRAAELRRSMAEVQDELRLLERAMELQRDVIQREQQAWVQIVCDRLRPAYREQIRRIADAMAVLSEACIIHAAFYDGLHTAGVSATWDLRPMGPHGNAPRLDVPYSTAWLWWQEALEHGLLED